MSPVQVSGVAFTERAVSSSCSSAIHSFILVNPVFPADALPQPLVYMLPGPDPVAPSRVSAVSSVIENDLNALYWRADDEHLTTAS